jgi:Winged helix DNA-binding domain
MRLVTDDERRARLALRHRLAPGSRAVTVEEATDSIVCLHATDHSSVVLAARARVAEFAVSDLDRALYDERSVVKQLAMRRTLFVLPRVSLPEAVAAAGPRVARTALRGLVRDIEGAGVAADGDAWIGSAEEAVIGALAERGELTTSELAGTVPFVGGSTAIGNGKWAANVAILPRLLAVLSARGLVVRSRHEGTWMNARPTWSLMDRWLGAPLPAPDPDEARAALVSRWLHAFGPGTEEDIAWWLGGSLGEVRAALSRLGAVSVALEGAAKPGWLRADDLDAPEPPPPWAALLPTLDPTTMGWKGRDWYLGPHRSRIFDSVGNGGTTAWWDGRIVGAWYQPPDGRVELLLLERLDKLARLALADEAERLTRWLDGARPGGRWVGPAVAEVMRAMRSA